MPEVRLRFILLVFIVGSFFEPIVSRPCNSNVCFNGGSCEIDEDERFFQCICPAGYTGTICETEVEECTLNCGSNGKCARDEESDTQKCECNMGFTGKTCEEKDESCLVKGCPQGQICLSDSEVPKCVDDPCNKNQCSNDSKCVTGKDYSYQCECPIGFTGKYCDDDLDECEYAPCKNGGTCVNTVPGFHCKCGPSYSGDLCQKHAGFCASKPCQNNGECIEQLTGYRCQCSSEWSGRDCDTPVPQCKCENPHHECNFVNKKQVCNCPEGFEGDKCDKRIDICDKINNCQNGGQCIGNSNSSSCICPSNYSGEFCETPVGECLVEGKKCENGGSCRKNLVGYSCDCPRAYTGKWCEKPRFSSLVTKRPDLCQQGYCFNNGTCSLLLTGAKCTCLPGFTGSRCETPSDPCFNNLCENDSQCVPKDDSYSCSCEPGFVGSFCEHTCTCQEDQECVENSSKDGSVCITVATSPLPAVTTTTTGFTTTTTASSTQTVTTTSTASTTTVTATTARPVTPKISEMSTNMPVVIPLQDIYNVTSCEACIGAKRCLEYDNRKFCVCPNNKDGKFCEKPLDVCSSLNCTRFQECHVTRTSHNAIAQCSCPPGYNGEKCEQPTTVTFSQNSLFLHQSKNIMIGASSAAVIYTVEFSFRTTAPHVHFVSGENILSQLQYSIGLSRGRLELNISSQVFDNFLEMNLNDGEWYKVVLNKTAEKTTVQIYEENGYQIAEKSLGVQTFEVFTTKFGLSGTKFMVGCLRDIKIDLDYVDPKEPSRSVDVRPGCERRVQCEKDTCQNGKCVDLWTNFRCECNRPFLPPFCINKLEEFTFGHKNESSRLTLKLNEEETMALRQRTDVSFLLRTNAENGSVIYMGEKGDDVATFISLEVQDGHIVAKSRLGGKRIMEMDGSAVINNNQPHLVELKRFNNHLKVYVDDKEDSQWTIDRPFSHPLLADQVLIGSDDTENSHLLKGSLQDMRINDKNVMFQENPPAFHVEPFGQSAFRKNLVKGTVTDDVCSEIIPCVHGICQNTFNDYECQCNRGWMGRDCEVKDFCVDSQCPEYAQCVNTHGGYICKSTATFFKSSFIKYKVNMPSSPSMAKNYNLTFTIRTRTSNGQLLKLQSSTENLSISFADHNLLLSYTGQSEPIQDEISHLIVDGDWHTVTLAEDAQTQRMVILIDENDFKSTVSNGFSLKRFIVDRNAKISIGRSYDNSGFEGCIRDFKISLLPELSFLSGAKYGGSLGDIIHFVPETRENVVETGCESTPQCGRIDPCKNGATCRDLFNLRKCDCLPGFEGDFCEINVDECEGLREEACGKFGTCVDAIGTYTCDCVKGHNGTRCEEVIDFCKVNPCENNGKCTSMDAKAICQCDEPYVGSRCQQKRTANCSVTPCENGSECLNLSQNSFSCQCKDGFEGLLCDIPIDNCINHSCKHGGRCISTGATYTCECSPDYEGEHCEKTVDTCSRLNPCMNGSCTNIWNGYLCGCQTGFEGEKCNVRIDACAKRPCMNNATCSNVAGGFECDCQKFYLGKQCEVAGICAMSPCAHGECVQHSANKHSCICEKGYTGELCEEQIDYCQSQPCENGASCINEVGYFRCSCIPGFSGETCGIDIDECTNKPCANGGECVDRVNAFECRCNGTGFEGNLCQDDIDECTNVPDSCQHGKCGNTPGSYKCDCDEGYIGKKCNVVNPCIPDAQNRTLHNCVHGECSRPSVMTLDSGRDVAVHECECFESYTGPQCTHMMEKRKSITLSYIVGPIISIFVVLCLLGCALFCFVAKGKGATQGTYSPSNQEINGARMHPMTTMLKQPPEERLI